VVFYTPSWVPKLPIDPPDSIPISEFVFNEEYGRALLDELRPLFTCGVTGQTGSNRELKDRVEYLARGLADELGGRSMRVMSGIRSLVCLVLSSVPPTPPSSWRPFLYHYKDDSRKP